jgi:aldose 1-epimerase
MKQVKKINKDLTMVTLKNDVLEVVLLNKGASIFNLIFKGIDVVVGPKVLADFIKYDHYYGKTIGRSSGRLFCSGFEIEGIKIYPKPFISETYSLHGGANGFSTRYFNYVESHENSAIFEIHSTSTDDGLPGDINLRVTYTLIDNILQLDYDGDTTETTLMNITNHAYFNLDGSPDILDHVIKVPASKYVKFEDDFSVSGIAEVDRTPFDLREPTALKEPIKKLMNTPFKGLDTIFLLDQGLTSLYSPKSLIEMTMKSTYPSLVVYTHNSISPDQIPDYQSSRYQGVALEFEYEPGGIHYSFLNSGILNKNQKYQHKTSYTFNYDPFKTGA